MNETALFVIDVQKGMIPHINESDKFISNLLMLINKARNKKIPIYFFKYKDTQKNVKRFGGTYWTKKNTKGFELIDEIEVSSKDLVFEKDEYSAFSVRGLNEILKDKKIKRIILSGLASQVCVQSTSDSAYELGYEVIVVKEAVGATSEKNFELGLNWMRKYTSRIVSVKEI